VATVLIGHGLLLGELLPAGRAPRREAAVRPVQLRQITPPQARVDTVRVAAVPVATRHAGAKTPAPTPPRAATTADPATPQAAARTATPPSSATPDPASADDPGRASVPVYATRLPPPMTLRYALQRGRSSGQAELHWHTDGALYELAWRGALAGVALPAATSVGRLDAHGIAPERQSESRRGRELRAVNFQRGSERITFSGPQREFPLLPGAQDRLTWMLQIAGVLAADPALAQVGSRVRLFVAGPRGDAAVWIFEVTGRETLDLPGGPVADAVHLQRAPDRPYDTRVDIWLDPARHHLPVRARLEALPAAEGSEFVLEAMTPP
jgi:hypothetical protein